MYPSTPCVRLAISLTAVILIGLGCNDPLAQKDVPPPPKRPERNSFVVSLNDKPLFEVVDDPFAEAGKVGVWTKADSVTHFDDLRAQGFDRD